MAEPRNRSAGPSLGRQTVYAAAGVLLAGTMGVGLLSAVEGDGEDVFRFEDRQITESSGLVVTDRYVVTTNDSGDSGRIFVVDPENGETVGVTEWEDDPTDVEALAPADEDHVWVGDIGDNRAERDEVEVTRIPFATGQRRADEETVDLVYPDGPSDAETLLADPRTGQLIIVTKDPMGGRVLAAPRRLADDEDNLLRARPGTVLDMATDGAFFPDGRHVVLRSLRKAVVYTYPGWREVEEFWLPRQRQGEGIAVAPDGRVYLTTEGMRSALTRVELPDAVRRAVAGERDGTGAAGGREPVDPSMVEPEPTDGRGWPFVVGGLFGLAALLVLLRSLRPR